jgi:hypothetical protein
MPAEATSIRFMRARPKWCRLASLVDKAQIRRKFAQGAAHAARIPGQAPDSCRTLEDRSGLFSFWDYLFDRIFRGEPVPTLDRVQGELLPENTLPQRMLGRGRLGNRRDRRRKALKKHSHARAVEHEWKIHQWHFSLQFPLVIATRKTAFGSAQAHQRGPPNAQARHWSVVPAAAEFTSVACDATFSSSDRCLCAHPFEAACRHRSAQCGP